MQIVKSTGKLITKEQKVTKRVKKKLKGKLSINKIILVPFMLSSINKMLDLVYLKVELTHFATLFMHINR